MNRLEYIWELLGAVHTHGVFKLLVAVCRPIVVPVKALAVHNTHFVPCRFVSFDYLQFKSKMQTNKDIKMAIF